MTSLLLSKNDYFIRQLRKELEHDVYPMVAAELIKAHPNSSSLLSQTLGRQPFHRNPQLVVEKGKSYTEQEVIQFYLEILKVGSN